VHHQKTEIIQLSQDISMTSNTNKLTTDLNIGRNAISQHSSSLEKAGRVSYYGAGNDVITLGDRSQTVYANEGTNIITTGKGNDKIYAGSGNDFINAGDGNNTIFAAEGRNRILTGKGNDLISTGSGNDTIYSGAGNDTIYAAEGNNIINAGIGNDLVYSGSGNDRFILEGGQGSVTIIGFNSQADRLRLGESLTGKSLTFKQSGNDTKVYAGDDLLATLKYVQSASSAIVDLGPLVKYTAIDLGSLSTNPNGSVNAASINDFGQIAGRFDTGATFSNQNATTGVTQSNVTRQGFIWENGQMVALTSTGKKNGQSDLGASNGATVTLLTPNVNTISNNGIILGTADEVRQPIPKATDRALVWQKSGSSYELTINDFGGLESYFFDTTDGRLIAGRNIFASGYEQPVYSDNGTIKTLSDLGGEGGTARGLNNLGQIVGYVDSDGKLNDAAVNIAVIWEKGSDGKYTAKNLGTFGAAQATLRDINDAGAIIGATSNGLTGTAANSMPFIYRDGVATKLGSLGGKTGSVNGVNEFGQVVGASQNGAATPANRAYIWSDGSIADLNGLVSTPITYNGAAVTLTSAVAINNFGDVLATGTYTYKGADGKDATGTRSYVLKAA
jgi:probable HAF family extracellular repeat protein